MYTNETGKQHHNTTVQCLPGLWPRLSINALVYWTLTVQRFICVLLNIEIAFSASSSELKSTNLQVWKKILLHQVKGL